MFNAIDFINIRRNEVKDKVRLGAVKNRMNGGDGDPCIYTDENRSQRSSLVLKNVKYGVEFQFKLTGQKNDREKNEENKHFSILKRRLERGQYFRRPCLGCSEFPATRVAIVSRFDEKQISSTILGMGDVDLGFMSYKVLFEDGGRPMNQDWNNPQFSNRATTVYYRPHMINGVIDVKKYREELKC